ncbi:response regulator transcription factor [Mesoterricola silvestris]|uniref:DNA-binding response regulator n=1 Tax=Mesoterricola silvestris TaxID=2927979 RepID=A0AA48KAU6_9BACT|nr:response regulator [Mesoterricola silvestris]BDU71858.1 DNA-binding response regulator [Mesoterricola silvestris]
MAEPGPSLLLAEDDAPFRERLATALRRRGLEVQAASCVPEALALAREESPEWALVDLRMPGGSGLDLVRELKGLDPETRVVVLTAYGSIATALEAVRLGAAHYLTKPADVDRILAAFTGGPSAPEEASTPSLDLVEWEHLQRVLADCEGNVSEAARRLGMHRRSLQRKLDRTRPPR